MNIGEVDELIGKFCRVITKVAESEDAEETFYDFGTVKYVDSEEGFILVDTKRGVKRLSLDAIVDVMPLEEYVSTKFEE